MVENIRAIVADKVEDKNNDYGLMPFKSSDSGFHWFEDDEITAKVVIDEKIDTVTICDWEFKCKDNKGVRTLRTLNKFGDKITVLDVEDSGVMFDYWKDMKELGLIDVVLNKEFNEIA